MKDWSMVLFLGALLVTTLVSCVKEEAGESAMQGIEVYPQTAHVDTAARTCDCFTLQDLQHIYTYSWQDGWFSDLSGCRHAPYDQLIELWLTNVGLPKQNFNYSVQAGIIDGKPFRSSAKYNHLTGQYELLCGGYTTKEMATPCMQLLDSFLQDMRTSHPAWDYCVRLPN